VRNAQSAGTSVLAASWNDTVRLGRGRAGGQQPIGGGALDVQEVPDHAQARLDLPVTLDDQTGLSCPVMSDRPHPKNIREAAEQGGGGVPDLDLGGSSSVVVPMDPQGPAAVDQCCRPGGVRNCT
jgi:hypothetical protein